MRRRAYMRARGRDKASRKRIWWRSEVSPIPGNGTAKHVYTDRYGHGLVDCSSSFRQWYFSLPRSDRVTLASSRSFSPSPSFLPLNFRLFPSSSVFMPFFAHLCRVVESVENWEIVGVTRIERKRGRVHLW